MLRKLLKYDIKSIWRVWWIIAIVVIGAEIIGALSLRGYIDLVEVGGETMSDSETVGEFIKGIASMIGLMTSFFVVIASFVVTEILIFIRYYKNFFSDEGYLTFTLPVNRRTHLISKTLNAIIWMAAEFGLLIIGVLLFILIAPTPERGLISLDGYRALGETIGYMWESIGGWLIAYVLEVILLLLCSELASIALVFLCITVGSVIARKRKVLVGIGIYAGATTIISSVVEFFGLFATVFMTSGLMQLLASATVGQVCASVFFMILVVCAIMATVALTFWCITMNCIRRKLNLA